MCIDENELKFIPRDNLTKRQKNLCNEQLAVNWDILCCILTASLEELPKPAKCLEGLGICGVYGILWEKHFGEKVEVTINGCQEDDLKIIKENAALNEFRGKVCNEDPCILLRQQLYDFIFLNCKTNTARYLDSVFSNIKKDAVLVITTSEDPALYWQAAEIPLRNYGGIIAKTSFHREVAVRLVIAEMARVAAKYTKGFDILCTVVYKPQQSFTIVARITKGTIDANKCIENIKKLAYCSICENRQFIPNSYFIDKVNNNLNCDCSKQSEGKVTIGIGPLWSGDIFDCDFIEKMMEKSKCFGYGSRVLGLLTLILEEARCAEKEETSPSVKKSKLDTSIPYFYINSHRHNVKELKLQKLSKIIGVLQKNGYRASRTHFDSEAIRTNAPVVECINLLKKNFGMTE